MKLHDLSERYEVNLNVKEILTNAQISTSKKIEKLLPEIESLVSIGVSHEVILNHLNSNGMNLTLGCFKTTLYRIRKRNKLLNKGTQISESSIRDKLAEETRKSLPTYAEKGKVENKKLQWDPHKKIDW